MAGSPGKLLNKLILIFTIALMGMTAIGIVPMIGSPSHAATRAPVNPGIEIFPVFSSIEPNVAFWTDMFTRYTRSQGVIHDALHLGRIYEVIRLDPTRTRTADKQNIKNKKAVLKKYKTILLALAAGKAPVTPSERQVAKLFGKKTNAKEFKRAAQSVRCQTGLTQMFKEGLIRSGAVIDEFKQIFKSHGLPTDLAYLPCVESSFDFTAYSKFGAAGIWQFTRGTGKMYMKIGYVVDQRRDPYISTQSAAKLLKRNYKKLGEWPLALTAYNHGVNGMLRAQKQKGSYEKIFNTYKGRSFKFASRNFYSEFLAARQVAKNYKNYFGNITLDKPVQFTRYTTKGYLPVKSLARGLTLDIQTIKQFNPSLRPPVFDGRKHIPKGFELRLPKQVSQKDISRVTAGLYQTKQKPSKFHLVQKGDTAGKISRTHSVSLSDLMMANGLSRRATIYIGQNLRIPVPGEEISTKKLTLAQNTPPIKSLKPVKQKKPIKQKSMVSPSLAPIKTTGKTTDKTPRKPVSTIVPPKKIEPLVSTPPRDKMPLQETKPAPQLVMSPPVAAPLAKEPEAVAKPFPEGSMVNPAIVINDLKIQTTHTLSNQLVGIIRVAPEETLGHYADWLQIPTQKIRTLNRLPYGRTISIDQKIKIPLAPKAKEGFEELRYEYHKEMEEDFFESFSIAEVSIYEVKNGDTIWSLCLNELDIPVWLLKKYNPSMDFGKLQPLEKINYPIVKSRQEFKI